jgi:Zinc knuckle
MGQDHFVKALDAQLRERVRTRGPDSLDAALSCALEFDLCEPEDSREFSGSHGSQDRPKNSTDYWHKKRGRNRARRAGRSRVNLANQRTENGDSTGEQLSGPSNSTNASSEALRAEIKTLQDCCQSLKREHEILTSAVGETCTELGRVRQQSANDRSRSAARSPLNKRSSDQQKIRYTEKRCYNCRRTGHLAAQCREKDFGRHRRDEREGRSAERPSNDSRRDSQNRPSGDATVPSGGRVNALRVVTDAEAFLIVDIGGRKREAILDSGCTHSILPLKWIPRGTKVKPVRIKTTTADNRQVTMTGQADVKFRVGRQTYTINVWLSDKIHQFLLGYDWLGGTTVNWRVGEEHLTVCGESVRVYVRSVGYNARRIHSATTVEIPPNCQRVVHIRCPYCRDTNLPESNGWMIDSGLISPYTISARVALSTLNDTAGLLVTNVSDEPVVIPEGMPLGMAEPVFITNGVYSATGELLTTSSPTTSHPTAGRERGPDQSFKTEIGTESDNYDSDTPADWESEIDRLSAKPIDVLLSGRPAAVTSSNNVSTVCGHSR